MSGSCARRRAWPRAQHARGHVRQRQADIQRTRTRTHRRARGRRRLGVREGAGIYQWGGELLLSRARRMEIAAVVVNPKEASLDYLLAKDLVSTQKSHVLVNIIFTRGVVGIFPQARRQPLGLSRACTRPLATATDATAPRSARAPRWRERSR